MTGPMMLPLAVKASFPARVIAAGLGDRLAPSSRDTTDDDHRQTKTRRATNKRNAMHRSCNAVHLSERAGVHSAAPLNQQSMVLIDHSCLRYISLVTLRPVGLGARNKMLGSQMMNMMALAKAKFTTMSSRYQGLPSG